MKTKSYVRFLNRSAHFDADLELADIVRTATSRGALTRNNGRRLFDYINPQRHPRLAARANNANSRDSAVTHLRTTLHSSFIKDLYEDVTIYFRDVLEAAAMNGVSPGRLVGQFDITFDAKVILTAGNWTNVVALVSQAIFRQIENKRNTKDLVAAMNGKLGLGIAQAVIDAALPYFELRHLLVHSDGIADQKFCRSFPNFGATAGQRILIDNGVIQNARTSILALIAAFDQAIVANNVVAQTELQP